MIEILCVPFQHPDDIYPASCRTPEQRREWEENFIESGITLPPLRYLPEGSLLRAECLRQQAQAKVTATADGE